MPRAEPQNRPARARARRRSAAAPAALLAAVALAACGGGGGPKLPSGHSNLQSIIEAEGFLHANPVAALQYFKTLGITRVRVYVPWRDIAPRPTSKRAPRGFIGSSPGDYPQSAWSIYDEIIRDAAAIKIGVDLTLGAPVPPWAAGPGGPRHGQYASDWEPSATDFGRFVHAIGERYSGHYKPRGSSKPLPRVDFWAIWNEANYGIELAPQATDHGTVEVGPRLYRGLLNAAWSALAASGHTPRRDTILIAETAPHGLTVPGIFNGMQPLRFIRALYCVDLDFKLLTGAAATERGCPATKAQSASFVADNPALFDASGWADHPYPDLSSPTARTAPPVGNGAADFAALGDLESTLDRAAAAYGRTPHLPIYSTEFGYRTDPPNGPADGLPLATAAAYLNEAEYLSWRQPRIRSYDQFLVSDPPAYNNSQFATGIEFSTGAPKPYVYDAFRMPLWLPVTRAQAGKPLVVWGCVRPAPVIKRRSSQVVMIQFAPASGVGYKTIRRVTLSGSSCYFETSVKFPASGSVRLAWSGSGATLYSRSQQIGL